MKIFLTKQERINYIGFDDRWAMALLIPVLAGIAFILFMGQRTDVSTTGQLSCYLMGLVHTLVYWTVNRFWVIRLRMIYPRQENTIHRIVLMLISSILTVVILEQLSDGIVSAFFPSLLEAGWNAEDGIFAFIVSITLCILVLSIYESIYFFTKYRQSIHEREKLAKANMQAQLAALKQQVNPHFLFNSLNTLANIIPEDPKLASRFVQRLAAVYRRVLEYRHQEIIPLTEEIVALRDYIFLLETRFENKLQIEFSYQEEAGSSYLSMSKADQIPAYLANLKIVPLSLQLLVENAIKHNVVSSQKPLLIEVKIDTKSVTVINNLQLRPTVVDSTGLGQQNIRQRYRLLTGRSIEILASATDYQVTVPLLNPQITVRYATA